ncbi:MAG: DUF2924 domain-containing protein [Phycisphaeraceae bacterium]
MNVERELDALRAMTTDQLRQRYAEVWDDQPRTRHKQYLIRKIIWKMQADAEGGLAERAKRLRARAAELADVAHVRATPPKDDHRPARKAAPATRQHGGTLAATTDPRLPAVGTVLTRKYKGRLIQVTVLADGFEFDGDRYRSLSAVAKAITGSHCNGFRFFNLGSQA